MATDLILPFICVRRLIRARLKMKFHFSFSLSNFHGMILFRACQVDIARAANNLSAIFSMSNHQSLNGCDYLMLGFDYELRRRGYAGNSCQIILELAGKISPDLLRRRLGALTAHCPVLNAHIGGFILPKWKLPRQSIAPQVRTHREDNALCEKLINEPLATERGELARFDLIERDDGRMKVIFNWAHALMDAHSAEHFVAVVGREELPLPAPDFLPPPRPQLPLSARLKGALKNLRAYGEFRNVAPRSPGKRRPDAPARLQFRIEKFSAAETAQVRAHATRLSGALGEAQYHAAVALIELQNLQQRLGCPSPSFVLPVPVGMRPKGNIEPLFSNQITSLLLQFFPGQLASVAKAVAALKTQTAQAMRDGVVEGCAFFTDFLRVLPLSAYVAFMRFGLKGEICSLFYGNTAAVSPLVTTFLGATIEDFTHIAAVPPSPGIGVIFYQFRGELRVTILHLAATLDENEAAQFAASLRARLLNP
jgi:hypothetical protein